MSSDYNRSPCISTQHGPCKRFVVSKGKNAHKRKMFQLCGGDPHSGNETAESFSRAVQRPPEQTKACKEREGVMLRTER